MSARIQKQLLRLNAMERQLGGTMSALRRFPGDEGLQQDMLQDLARAERELRRLERKLNR